MRAVANGDRRMWRGGGREDRHPPAVGDAECRRRGGRECEFFFQAEDGIRDLTVTGVQTCALPISRSLGWRRPRNPNATEITRAKITKACRWLSFTAISAISANAAETADVEDVMLCDQIGRASCRERV